ncbi:multidrug ABC transporter ATP-binding protein [Halobacteriovorax marinus]|uniref:Multidrug ABC transporter ATP-binding protein n=1 Tax=Halobacteriovorax marinus TaxID=97084 RepID=A0A1Y5FHY7_9BACT|nr:multidrug ABC transporter ATP-binding protein [Halobacteriovorax marinus]
MIQTNKLKKSFKSYKKKPGFLGSIQSLYKRDYITKDAVADFDLDIPEGQIVGLLGPNGAGKTTLMKMFTGIIVPTSGEINILGHRPSDREKSFRKKIALVMGQKSQLWWDIPAMDSFLLLQKYYEISKDDFDEKIEHMSELLGVKELLHIHVRKLSLGERMKMELMASLIHSPEIIFLDEPTIGLDLVAQENIRNFIKDYHRKNNCTIILTSHYMADVQELCSKIVLILNGKKAYDGDIQDFEKLLGHEKRVSFSFKNPISNDDKYFEQYTPEWAEGRMQVELLIPEEQLRSVSSKVITNYEVEDFNTEVLPIEKVMKTLILNPEILSADK